MIEPDQHESDTMRLTINNVNAALKAAGIDAELIKGDGYYWFHGLEAAGFYSSSVAVFKLTDLPSVEAWVDEYRRLKADDDQRMGRTPAAAPAAAAPAGLPRLVPQSPARVKWETKVVEALCALCNCSTGDAQAIMEGQPQWLEDCWIARTDPARTAGFINTAAAKIDEASTPKEAAGKPIESKDFDGIVRVLRHADGRAACEGESVKSSRGEDYVLTGGRAPHKESSEGKVWVGKSGEFYPSVFGLKWIAKAV